MIKNKSFEFNEGYDAYFSDSKPNPYDPFHEPYEYSDWKKGQDVAAEEQADDDHYY